MKRHGNYELQVALVDAMMGALRQVHPIDGIAALETCIVTIIGQLATDEADGLTALAAINGDMADGIRTTFAGGTCQ